MSTETETGEGQSIGLREQIEQAATEIKEREEAAVPPEKEASERDDQGRFAAKEETPPETATETPPVSEEEKPEAVAPTSWSADAKAKWAELPPEIQKEISKREAEVHKGFTQQDNERKFGKAMQQAIAPYAQQFQAERRDPVQEVQNMLRLDQFLRSASPEQKMAAIHQIARGYGVDLGQAPEQQFVDPQVADLRQQLQQVQSFAQNLPNMLAEKQALQEWQDKWKAFQADPANTHLETVKEAMHALLQSGQAADYQEAYDKACWLNPEIRSMRQADQLKAAEAKRIEEAKRKTAAAKKAGSSISGGPGGTPSTPAAASGSLRDQLAAALKDASGRV